MFKVAHLGKKIKHKHLLKDVSFNLDYGQIGIFLGGSGVGKSTLLRVCNHLDSCDEGSFFLDDKPLDLTTAHKEHKMGLVFQQFHLFENLSVINNITFALTKIKKMSKEEADQKALELLKDYGLDQKAYESIHKLSGGQKQRLALIRALALEPKIICLDEPTSALDPTLSSYIASSIEQLASQGLIVLVATHDMSLVSKLKAQLFLMQEGAIIERCTTQDFYANPSVYPALERFMMLG
jgi:polar amino acid transport system ATP-binding protein